MATRVDPKWGLRFRHTTAVFLAVVGVLLYLLTAVIGTNWSVIAPLAVLAVLLSMVTYRHRTLFGWIGMRRRARKTTRREGLLITSEGVGIVWDGEIASTFLELKPKPYAVTVIEPDESLSSPTIPVDVIREELTQFDIRTHSVSIITAGSQYVNPSTVSNIYHSVTGPVPALLNGRTLIKVSVALEGSIDSMVARGGARESVPVGLGNTVSIAAARIRRRLEREGWDVDTLTRRQVSQVTEEIKDVLAEPMSQEQWSECGTPAMLVSVHTPTRNSWRQSRYREWHQFDMHRMMTVLRLNRQGTHTDHAEMYLAYATLQPGAMDLSEAVGLWREYGQQGDILTEAIPTYYAVRPTAVPGMALSREEPFPIEMHPCGVGTFVGYGANRSRVFVNLARGGVDPLYVIAPVAFLQQLLARMLTTGKTIDIRVPDDGTGIWPQFADKMRAPALMGYYSIPEPDIVVAPENDLPRPEFPGQVVIAWTTTPPASNPASAIVVFGKDAVVSIGGQQIPFQWALTSGEARLLTVEVGGQQRRKVDSEQQKPRRRRLLSKPAEGRHARR
jgi:type VII secretion protein EccE